MKTLFQTMRSFQKLHRTVKAIEVISTVLVIGFWIAPFSFNIYTDRNLFLLAALGFLLSIGVAFASYILEDKVYIERTHAEIGYKDMCSDYIDRQC